MLRTLILVGIGGAVGSVLRYLTAVLTNRLCSSDFPFATFAVNLAGCLLIGILLGFAEKYQVLNANLRNLLVTGFCGGYTTFSAFASENVNLLQQGHMLPAIVYMAGSILLGLFAVWLGFRLV